MDTATLIIPGNAPMCAFTWLQTMKGYQGAFSGERPYGRAVECLHPNAQEISRLHPSTGSLLEMGILGAPSVKGGVCHQV